MALSINNNVAALNAYRNLSNTQNDLSKSLEKLSSGLRINRAADDAAGLAISEGLRAQIGGTTQAVRNAQDGISVVQTAEGALTETHSILQRMRTLAVQASNDGGLSSAAKSNVQDEIGQLQTELTRIAKTTQFNGKTLLDGTYSGVFQVGANTSADDQIGVAIATGTGMSAAGLGVDKINVGGSLANATVKAGTAGALSNAVSVSTTLNAAGVTALSTATAPVVTVGGTAIVAPTFTAGAANAQDNADALGGAIVDALVAKNAGTATADWAVTVDATSGAINVGYSGNVAIDAANIAIAGTDANASTNGQGATLAPSTGASFSATLDLANIGGKITLGDATLDLDSVAAGFTSSMTASDKASAVNAALATFYTAEGGNGGAIAGAAAPTVTFGADGKGTLTLNATAPVALGSTGPGFTVDDSGSATAAIDKIDAAITQVSKVRSQLGAVQNRFDHTINNLNVAVENLTASESRIRDTDMASEMVKFTQAQILSQAGTTMLAQAKNLPQSVLTLLQQ